MSSQAKGKQIMEATWLKTPFYDGRPEEKWVLPKMLAISVYLQVKAIEIEGREREKAETD